MKLMNKSVYILLVSILSVLIVQMTYAASISIGQPAPNFTLSDQNNQKQTLSAMHGKWLVLYFTSILKMKSRGVSLRHVTFVIITSQSKQKHSCLGC